MSKQEVVIKKVPAMTVASLREVIPGYRHVGQLLGEIFAHLGRNRVRPLGPPLAMYYDEEYAEKDADVEAAVPVDASAPGGERVKVRELPAVDEMACIVHKGSYDNFSQSYNQLMGWLEANGYRIVGPNREVYIQGPGGDAEPADYVTEVQFPVEKA